MAFILVFSSLGFTINPISGDRFTGSDVVCRIVFDEPVLSSVFIDGDLYTEVTIDDCINMGEPGFPSLPVFPVQVLIPLGKSVASVNVDFESMVLFDDDLSGRPVVPQQIPVPFSKSSSADSFVKDEQVYEMIAPIFVEDFEVGDLGFCRGYTVLNVLLHPVKYIPKNGKLFYCPEMTIHVELVDDEETFSKNMNSFFRNSKSDKKFISSFVENPEDIDIYSNDVPLGGFDQAVEYTSGLCDPSGNYDYVIITSDALRDTNGFSYNWSNLIDHRQDYSGLSGIIVTVEEIDACTGYYNDTALYNDSQAHIREFCKDAYQDWNTEYIVLGGDWDSSHQVVPFRLFTDPDEEGIYDTMSCDMYYSHLDGDWYDNTEGIWGGGKNSGVNDLYGELFVGRFTVSNAEMISNVVNKIINYDSNISLDTSWLGSSSFWGGSLGWTSTSKQYMEELRLGTDTYRTFTGFEEWNSANPLDAIDTSDRIYHADLGSTYDSYFVNSVENDNFSIVNHLDHSSWSSPFSLTSWDLIFNTKPFFGYTQGCLSGRFHENESGCERMMCNNFERHAFALVLNTGYGYGNSFTANGASQYICAYFWDYFFNNQSDSPHNWQLGKAMNYAQGKMAGVISTGSHAWCYAWYSANFFGDPAQKLRLNNTIYPVGLSSESPSNGAVNISLATPCLSITMNDPDNDFINWTIQTSPNIGTNSGNNENDGVKTCNISDLSYNTNYTWYVNTSDGLVWTNETYFFITRASYTPNTPDGFTGDANSRYGIDLSWVDDLDADSTRVEWYTDSDGSWNPGDHSLLYNGSAGFTNHTGLDPGTTCFYKAWSWNSTDNVWSDGSTCNAITNSNNPPGFSSQNPANGSTNQQLNLTWSITIVDDDGDLFNWTVECNNNQTNSSNSDTNGSKELSLSGLSYNTFYLVWVNATDGTSWTCEWYRFWTRQANAPDVPGNFSTEDYGCYQINLLWDKDDRTDYTYIEWNTDETWDRGTGVLLYNDAGVSTTHTGLDPGATCYYQAWSWNSTDNVWSTSYASSNATTSNDTPLSLTSPSPSNQSTGVSISTTMVSVTIQDPEGSAFNWTIATYPDIGSSFGTNDTNGSKTCSISGLSYDTTYYWYVNASDRNNAINESYYFTTRSEPVEEPPPSGGGGPPPPIIIPNVAPTADAKGPYKEFVNNSIMFNGSDSSDTDGTISSWLWDFGDGTTGTGETANHTYTLVDNYTISLTVTDDDGDSDTATSYATIKSLNITGLNPINPEPDNSDGDTQVSLDDDNDGIPNTVEDELGTKKDDSSGVTDILIQDVSHYVIDIDGDGDIDVFYNSLTGASSDVKKLNIDTVLIDFDSDGRWDYQYNLQSNSLSSYSTAEAEESLSLFALIPNMFTLFLIIVVLLILLLCILLLYMRKVHVKNKTQKPAPLHDYDFLKHGSFAKGQQVHYITRTNGENHPQNIKPPVKHLRINDAILSQKIDEILSEHFQKEETPEDIHDEEVDTELAVFEILKDDLQDEDTAKKDILPIKGSFAGVYPDALNLSNMYNRIDEFSEMNLRQSQDKKIKDIEGRIDDLVSDID